MSKYRDTEPSGTKKLNLWLLAIALTSIVQYLTLLPLPPLPIGDDISIITSTT